MGDFIGDESQQPKEPRAPRFTQIEKDSLSIVLRHYKSTYHYRECKHLKKCGIKDKTCRCEKFHSMYPNADIVADNVQGLIKKIGGKFI